MIVYVRAVWTLDPIAVMYWGLSGCTFIESLTGASAKKVVNSLFGLVGNGSLKNQSWKHFVPRCLTFRQMALHMYFQLGCLLI